MTRRTRILLYALIAFVILCGLVLMTAYSRGADPFHPRSRHIWLLSLVAAAYAAVRGAMIVDRVLTWNAKGKDGRPGLRGFGFLRGKDHAIDKRMAERRARVEAAKAKQSEKDGEAE